MRFFGFFTVFITCVIYSVISGFYILILQKVDTKVDTKPKFYLLIICKAEAIADRGRRR